MAQSVFDALRIINDKLSKGQLLCDGLDPLVACLQRAVEDGVARAAQTPAALGWLVTSVEWRRLALVAGLREFLVVSQNPISRVFTQLAYLSWHTDDEGVVTDLSVGAQHIATGEQVRIVSMDHLFIDSLAAEVRKEAPPQPSETSSLTLPKIPEVPVPLTKEELKAVIVRVLAEVGEFFFERGGLHGFRRDPVSGEWVTPAPRTPALPDPSDSLVVTRGPDPSQEPQQ